MTQRRTRDNSRPLNARVTLDLAHRLHLHLLEQRKGLFISDFVSEAIEEKLARERAADQERQT
jgi:post-segregation antitoxin (ccd killing protein)